MSADIVIDLEVLATMIKYDLSVEGKETAGLLIGEEKDGVVHIDEVRIGKQTANAVHVEISTEELAMAAIEISERADGKSIVGWIHTHPGLSAFLSSTDINTQNIYQAQMPNAVAIVIDDVKYSHTWNINDLDLGVFRVANNKAVRQNYSVKNSYEFGLKAYVSSDKELVSSRTVKARAEVKNYIPVMDKNQFTLMRANIEKLIPDMNSEDVAAIKAWIELADAMQSGDYVEVPVDFANLGETMSDSMERIDDTLEDLDFEIKDKAARTSLFVVLLTTIIEFTAFYLFVLS